MRGFNPIGSVLIAVTAASATTPLPGTLVPGQDRPLTVRLHNAGPAACFVAFGEAGVTAAADGTSMILPVGNTESFDLRAAETHIATIGAGGGSTDLYVSRGVGL